MRIFIAGESVGHNILKLISESRRKDLLHRPNCEVRAIVLKSQRDIYNELSNEEDLINNCTIYIEKVRTCETLFKDAISDSDKYTTEDVKTELDHTRRNLLMVTNRLSQRLSGLVL